MKNKYKNMSYYREDEDYAFGVKYTWWQKMMWIIIMFPFYALAIPVGLIAYGLNQLIEKIFKIFK